MIPEVVKVRNSIRDLKTRTGLDWDEDDLAVALHVINRHKVDQAVAFDQTSRGPNDYGIDGWVIAPAGDVLWIYQSKLTDNKKLALAGCSDLVRACQWVENALIDGRIEQAITNPALYNLAGVISTDSSRIQKIHFILLTTFDSDLIQHSDEYDDCIKQISKSKLNAYLTKRGGNLEIDVELYDTKRGIISTFKKYEVEKIKGTKIDLRIGSHLGISYIPLVNLVRLYRERGDVLFDKNVRLSLMPFQKSKNRVMHPMEETLNAICSGSLKPEIFPFYHVGITISADKESEKENGVFDLEGPSVVNGCQTITIASHFYDKLEKTKDKDKLDRFGRIPVLAKIVVGTTAEELREITNCNNRQNPIENWQLFSNDEMQIQIESALADLGIFYERQKGKLATIIKKTSFAESYANTNNTSIEIPVLAQVLCLFQNRMQWAAKGSEIFYNEENYRKIFNEAVIKDKEHIVLAVNICRAAKRGLVTYQRDNEQYSQNPFKSPILRAHLQQLAIAYVWQKKRKQIDKKYLTRLNKSAPPGLTKICHDFYPRILAKTKKFYKDNESNGKEIDVNKRNRFFQALATNIGVDLKDFPFVVSN